MPPRSRQHGYTLVEVILAVVLTSALALTLTPLLTQGLNVYVLATQRARLLHDVRFALTKMSREIVRARAVDIRLAQPTRFTFVDTSGGPADYGFIAAGTRGTLYRTGIPVLTNVNNLQFRYFDANGNPTSSVANIRRIGIQLTANAPVAGTLTLRTEVFPRPFAYTAFR